jgi:FecR protein
MNPNERFTERRQMGGNWLAVALFLACVGFTPALEADAPAAGGRAERLSYVEGQVKITEGGQLVSNQAPMNAPLFEGMQVTTGNDGQAEIQFEDGSVARLSPNSALTLTKLRGEGGSGEAEITLNGGLGYFELQGSGQSGQMSVNFGDVTATPSGFTVFRVKLDTPPGEVAVFSGNAHLEGGNGALTLDLHGGESVALTSGDEGHSVVAESIQPDSWDAWNSDRDQQLNAQASSETGAASNLSPEESQNPAWNDLDANGNWYNVPGQGYVWSPYDAANAGWDPYGYGNWMYTPGNGYLWASGYPWGYLPYQCGMWNFYNGFGWGWSPGLGGCQPWWFGGGYVGPAFGTLLPGGYRPPRRPLPPTGPRHGPIPMVAVNRRMSTTVASLPLRDRNTPVTIAGNRVEAVRPAASHPEFQRPAADFASHEAQIYGGAAHPQSSGSGFVSGHSNSSAPQIHSAPAPRPAAAPSYHAPSGGGGARAGGGGSHGGGGGSHR